MSVATFLQEGSPMGYADSTLTISFPEESTFHKETLEEKDNKKLIERIFSEKLKATVYVEFTITGEHTPHEHEEDVSAAIDVFKGKVVSKWHRD